MRYACAPAPISAEIRKVHQFTVFAVNTPAQHAFAEHLAEPRPYLELPSFDQAKRDLFVAGLASTPFRTLACEETYFVLADYSQVSDLSEDEFAKLVVEYGVASIPVSVFYYEPVDHQVVRFYFAKQDSTLNEALTRLAAL